MTDREERARIRAREWYTAHPEKVVAYRRARKVKTAAYNKTWNEAHKMEKSNWTQAHKGEQRERDLVREYGISIAEYNHLFELQEGKCSICGTHQSELKKRLHIDHNHETGKVRGLLCQKCNVAIGLLQDNWILLQNAANYIHQYSEDCSVVEQALAVIAGDL